MSDPNTHAFQKKISDLETELRYERVCAAYYDLMTQILLSGGSLDDPRLHELGRTMISTSKDWEAIGGQPGKDRVNL